MSIATLALHLLPFYTIFVVVMLMWLVPLTISQFRGVPQVAYQPVAVRRWVVVVERQRVYFGREIQYMH